MIDVLIDVFFLCDVVLNTITAYVDDGHLVTDHRAILLNYSRTWMAFDIISSFPFDWVVLASRAAPLVQVRAASPLS